MLFKAYIPYTLVKKTHHVVKNISKVISISVFFF